MHPVDNLRHFDGRLVALCAALATALGSATDVRGGVLPTADGFYGIWYAVGPSSDQYAYKYSGGLGTYMQQTSPLAIYSEDVNRTYFVYGGTNGTNNSLRNYLSYFDHATGLLARPREVRNVGGSDNHRNAVFTIDDDGHLYVFGNSHGDGGTGNMYKSSQPHSITEFDEVPLPGSVFNNTAATPKVVLSYSNPYYVSGNGLMLVYNQYHDGRAAHVAKSSDGIAWTDQSLFDTEQGHYTLARQNGNTIGVSADYHRNGSLDNRTNLYYVQTSDFGTTWTNSAGTPLSLPLTTRNNPALVYDYFAENKLVYMKDVDYDATGNPILLYLTVSDAAGNGHLSGPQPGGRTLHTAHWTGGQWQIRDVTTTDHSYDHGELVVESDGTWRITAPFLDGPQQYGTGGEVGVWTSQNQGASWQLADQLTQGSQFNHTYVRHPVGAHDDFYAYWADGNAFAQSASRLYFATKDGDVYRMPTQFAGDFAAPEFVQFGDPDPDPMPLAYEGFDYANDGSSALLDQNGGTGWGGPWAAGASTLNGAFTVSQDDTSLSSAAFPFTATGDRSVATGPGGGSNSNQITRLLPTALDMSAEGGVLYASFLLRKRTDGGASSDNIEVDLIPQTGESTGGAPVRLGSTSGDLFFLNVATNTFGSVALGETYFMVLIVESHGETNDMASALVFDTTETVPTAEPTTWDGSHSFNSTALLDRIRLWIGAASSGDFDELRIGQSWADVTSVMTTLPGDFNGDGSVDAADYVVWRKGLGTTHTPQQYDEWRANFGKTTGDSAATGQSGSAAVPEPSTWPMMLAGLLWAASGRTISIPFLFTGRSD